MQLRNVIDELPRGPPDVENNPFETLTGNNLTLLFLCLTHSLDVMGSAPQTPKQRAHRRKVKGEIDPDFIFKTVSNWYLLRSAILWSSVNENH